MFRLIDTIEGRHCVWTATADRAIANYDAMTKAGLAPAVTDLQGRPVSLGDLQKRATAQASRRAS